LDLRPTAPPARPLTGRFSGTHRDLGRVEHVLELVEHVLLMFEKINQTEA
jgi:hypothetical protein